MSSKAQRRHPALWISSNLLRGMRRAVEFGRAWHVAPPSVAGAVRARQSLTAPLGAVELTTPLPPPLLTHKGADGGTPSGATDRRAQFGDQTFSGDELHEVSLVGARETIARRLRLFRDR